MDSYLIIQLRFAVDFTAVMCHGMMFAMQRVEIAENIPELFEKQTALVKK